MTKRSKLNNLSHHDELEYLFEEQEKAAQHKAIMFEWHSNSDGCDDCVKYNGQLFSLDNAPTTHPNCKCELVTEINGHKITVSVAELSAEKYEDRKNYIPGSLSGKYESNGNPAIIGYDSTGGYSYGKYQIAAKNGTMKDYISYLKQKPQYKKFATELENAGGVVSAGVKAPAFEKKWQELAKNQIFVNSQTEFIIDKKVRPVLKDIKDIKGFNLEYRHPVVKDVIFSLAVQHGEGGASKLLYKVFGYNVQDVPDKSIITKIYDERSKVEIYFKSSKEHIRQAVKERLPKECKDALDLLYR